MTSFIVSGTFCVGNAPYFRDILCWTRLAIATLILLCYNHPIVVLKKEEKEQIIKKHKQHEGDTGSAEVQIALLSERINQLVEHLKKNKKDNHSRRGLLMLVGQRKKLLIYLQREDIKKYGNLIADLKLR